MAAFEYEALVGHLYIVGGRSISASPPGALVEVAPRKAARGREADTVFALVMPSGEAIAPVAFYEQMAALAAERYFSSTGSVTSGLRNVFNTINQNLFDHNQSGKRPYEANLICAVLRGSDLYVGRVGPGVMILRSEASVVTSPEDVTDDEALYTAPLGVQPVPNVRMSQHRVSQGARLLMADANLAELDIVRIGDALASTDLAVALTGVKELARLQLTVLAVEFVPPEVSAPVPVIAGESTAEISKAARSTSERARVTAENTSAPAPAEAPAAPAPSTAERKRRERNQEIERRVKGVAGAGALSVAGVLKTFNRSLDHFFPPPETAKRRLPTGLASLMVILLPVTVSMLVIFMSLAGAGTTEFELCLEEAVRRVELARSLATSNAQTQLGVWGQAIDQLALCETLRPGDPTLASFRLEGQSVLDRINGIDRREVFPIDSFTGAQLTRIVAQGPALFVLDSSASMVYRVQLSGDGRSRSGVGQAIAEMREGEIISGVQIGRLIDIAYSLTDNLIMAVDENGVVITCRPNFLIDCTAQRLIADNWVSPAAVTVWQSRLYVLDPGAGDTGQIWRYTPTGERYASAPEEYFGTQQRPNLRSATDLAITSDGDVYVLLSEGLVNRFRGGEPLQFTFGGFPPGQEPLGVTSMFLDDSPAGQVIYLVHPGRRTIYEVLLAGTFANAYQASNQDNFALIADVVADSQNGVVYVVSGNAILGFERNPGTGG